MLTIVTSESRALWRLYVFIVLYVCVQQEQWSGIKENGGAGTSSGSRLLLIIACAAGRFPVETAAVLSAELQQVSTSHVSCMLLTFCQPSQSPHSK